MVLIHSKQELDKLRVRSGLFNLYIKKILKIISKKLQKNEKTVMEKTHSQKSQGVSSKLYDQLLLYGTVMGGPVGLILYLINCFATLCGFFRDSTSAQTEILPLCLVFKIFIHIPTVSLSSDAFVVYWLACSPSERRVEYSNPVRGSQPLLAAKAVHLQPSIHVFGMLL